MLQTDETKNAPRNVQKQHETERIRLGRYRIAPRIGGYGVNRRPYLGERRDGEPVRRKAGGLAPGAVGDLLVVVAVTCKRCTDEDYATREVEHGGEGEGREEHLRLEAATGRKAERRRRWSGAEEKGSGRDREVVAIPAAATDSMDGDGDGGERARGQRWGAAGVRFFVLLRLENFILVSGRSG
jgi:hypothetical protein